MRYIGSKTRLLDFIKNVIESETAKTTYEYETFSDVFGGTGAVGKWAKSEGYTVIGNDLLYFSYVLQSLNIAFNEYPKFSGLTFLKSDTNKERTVELINYLNGLNPVIGFITENYSEHESERKYFSIDNAKLIDAIRSKIEEFHVEKNITNNEYIFLIGMLIEAIPFISNTSGVYGAYLKKWDNRALKKLNLILPPILETSKTHIIYNKNANDLVAEISSDILYLDPPYNARQYLSNYHLLETVALYDKPSIFGVSGVRNDQNKKSDFCSKVKALNSFKDLINNSNAKLILLSYNSEGLMSEDDIISVLSTKGDVEVYRLEYRRFQSDNTTNRNIEKNKVDEIIFACLVK